MPNGTADLWLTLGQQLMQLPFIETPYPLSPIASLLGSIIGAQAIRRGIQERTLENIYEMMMRDPITAYLTLGSPEIRRRLSRLGIRPEAILSPEMAEHVRNAMAFLEAFTRQTLGLPSKTPATSGATVQAEEELRAPTTTTPTETETRQETAPPIVTHPQPLAYLAPFLLPYGFNIPVTTPPFAGGRGLTLGDLLMRAILG